MLQVITALQRAVKAEHKEAAQFATAVDREVCHNLTLPLLLCVIPVTLHCTRVSAGSEPGEDGHNGV